MAEARIGRKYRRDEGGTREKNEMKKSSERRWEEEKRNVKTIRRKR